MKREYLTTEQGQLLLEQMGLEAFLMFTIQELNDYITQYNIEGIPNAAALLIQSECQSNEALAKKLKIDPYADQIIAEEIEGTDYEQGIIFFNVSADVGKKKPRQLGTAIAIDYYNCVQTIVDNEMLEEDQAITADEVVKAEPEEEFVDNVDGTVEEEILQPEMDYANEEQPEFVEEVEEVIEEGPTPEEVALAEQQEAMAAAQQAHEQQMLEQQEMMRQQQIAHEQQMLAQQQEMMRQQQIMQQQELERQQQMMMQQQMMQQQELERQQQMMMQQNSMYNQPIEIPKDVNYAEIYEDEIASDEPDKNVKYYDDHNKFLNKVYYAKSHGYEGKREYEFYEKKDEAPVEFQRVDYNREFDELGMPIGPDDIQIEDIEQIGNSGYVPYPFGPLKRSPVPYDL